jgi:pilus assembly protein CpaF
MEARHPEVRAVSSAMLSKIRRQLLARLAPEVLNPFARTPERAAQLRQTLAEVLADPEVDLAASPMLVAEIEAEICGLGPLQPLVDDPDVADILVNAPDAVFVERGGRLEATPVHLAGTRELIQLSERIAALAGRELSVAHPVVDARMPDGSRVNAVIPPIGGPYLSIRKFNRLRLDLAPGGAHGRSWVDAGGMSAELADFLIAMVRARANVLIAGETGAGKTTLLRSLTDTFGPDERVGVVEDTAELALESRNRFNLETLHPSDLGRGEAGERLLDVGDLVANALRMRPDRLIVGEIRLPKEAFYTLQALHTGHDGSATTIHASSAEDGLFRLELLARQSMRDLTAADLRAYIARVFDLIVVLRRLRSGRRITYQVAALDGLTADARYALTDVYRAELGGSPPSVGWRRNPDWQPSPRLAVRIELEGSGWT